MKKALSIFAIASLLLFAIALTEANAAESGSITITVSVSSSLSVELLDADEMPCSSIALGTVGVGSTAVSSMPVYVKNNGSGVAERFTLSHSYSGDWTSGTAAGDETFALKAGFGENPELIGWSHVDLVTSNEVEHDNSDMLWFQFMAPTSTAVTEPQSITVTVTAQLP